jgi:cation transport regulator ChaB
MTSTLAETPNATAVATVAPITTATTATPVIETATQKPPKPSRTIRIHVNLKDQPRPVVFNYRQLYKRELKKIETHEETNVPMPSAVDSADDLFYQELLKKAESYAMDDDDAGDDGSDEETALVSHHQSTRWFYQNTDTVLLAQESSG